MKIGDKELAFTPIGGNAAVAPRVSVQLRAYGMKLGDATMATDQARQLAAEIVAAADAAEGKAA